MANRTTVKITDMGWQQAQRDFKQLKKIEGVAGIQGKAGSEQVLIGAVQEFGSPAKKIPSRSYIRSTVNENQAVYKSLLKAMAVAIGQGNNSLVTQLSRIMLKVESDIKRKITTLKTPPNAPSTIKKKGSDNPLIDKGILRQSITSVVRDRTR